MSIYVIADLHLSFSTDKPMNIFGSNWDNHANKIREDWISKVKNEDTVLLLGDFSWAMTFKEAKPDFEYLNSLPGRKIMLKGNHDYWWNTVKKIKEFLLENDFNNIDILYNNSYLIENKIICGTRGWTLNNDEENEKVLNRELIRLELSLKNGIEKYGEDKEIIACLHYPPTSEELMENSKFIKLMNKYNVKKCYYGHLHGDAHKDAIQGNINGIQLELISCDYTDFKLIRIQ